MLHLSDTIAEALPTEIELALAHTPSEQRDALRVAFELDQRLARIVAATTEPMLGQMRLAWWRDMLATAPEGRPSGDAVLDGIGRHWRGHEEALSELVDGWEVLIVAENLNGGDLKAFASGRAAPFASILAGGSDDQAERILAAMSIYAFADLATGLSDQRERGLAIQYGMGRARPPLRLPNSAKGLRVLEALALRALKRGGRPLMEGRGAALIATRAAIFGR